MITVYSDDHRLHNGKFEFAEGKLVPAFECPDRADIVLEAVRNAGLGDVIEPNDFGLDPVLRVHDRRFVDFLSKAWDLWSAEGREHDALPYTFTSRDLRQCEPDHIDGKLGYFAFDAGTPITAGTWAAVVAAANVALTGAARLLDGDRPVFSLCRPPGHHAAADCYGGYCFLNNAAIAAQFLLDDSASRVAILDIDYHHGNGTQSIFYDRDDVLFASIHADPDQEFPYFLGREDEKGLGAGVGCNINFPLAWNTEPAEWFAALDAAIQSIARFSPDSIVVSLGVDTYMNDPISRFRLTSEDFLAVGERIARLGLPILFVMEGGYAVDEIGTNVANVLLGTQQESDDE